MGRAAAIAYAREGADVAINYHPDEEADACEVIELIKAEGRKGIALPGDLRSAEFRAKLVEDAVAALGGLDILVSNAARQQTKASVLDISNDDFDATIKTNIYAPFWIIKAALPHLKPGSSIIGTTSEQATNPSAELYDYAQTKAATTSYVMSLAKQLGPKGIRLNGVAPGPVWTPLQVSGEATQEKLQKFGGISALGRPGQPAELASIYVQLAATDASFTTGGIYGANGGGTVTGNRLVLVARGLNFIAYRSAFSSPPEISRKPELPLSEGSTFVAGGALVSLSPNFPGSCVERRQQSPRRQSRPLRCQPQQLCVPRI